MRGRLLSGGQPSPSAGGWSTLTGDAVNYLNIGLMILSCLLAFVAPFELFLFSYAALGPLHYLTEISWLHDRRYFVGGKRTAPAAGPERAWLALVALTLIVMLYGFVSEKILHQDVTPVWEIALFYTVFVTASLAGSIRKKARNAAIVGLTLVALVLFRDSRYYALVAFFLITIVHVFVFTAAFILFGALKSRSRSGILSLAVFGLCAVSFFVYVPDAFGHSVGDTVRSGYRSFQTLNAELIKFFHLGAGTSVREIYESRPGLMVMRLIAFAYTYHYLNWFSKTSIIKWHEIAGSRTALILGLWVGSLAIYGYSYQAGIAALYFLSVLHVMLEFPLDHQTLAGIAKEMHVGAG